MEKKKVGGRAKAAINYEKRRPITMQEHQEALERVFDMGVQAGLEAAERVRVLPTVTCPMCLMEQELVEARDRLRRMEYDQAEGRRSRSRSWG